MFSNTKLLIIISFIIIVIGFSLLFLGLKPVEKIPTLPTSTPILTTPSATQSGIPTNPETFGIEGEKVYVTKVIDGDTIQISTGQTVRFIGIDTPETKDPRKSVQCFGKEASLETSNLLSGKEIILQKDISEVDKYQRLLRYIFLPLENGQVLFVQDYLVREGFARVLTYPPDIKYNEQLREAESSAKDKAKGLWGRC